MTEAAAKKAAKEFAPTTGQKKKARDDAKDKGINTAKGSIIVKPQLCGKYCGTCPHGPYAWHVYNGDWTYIGSVGGGIGTGSVGKMSETEGSEKTESSTDSISLAPQIKGELDGDTLEVELGPTGNKKTVAKINGPDEKYGLEREWVTEYGEKMGSVQLEEGDIIEASRSSHSGKNTTRKYYEYNGGELVEVSKNDVETTVKQWGPSAKETQKRNKRVVKERMRTVQDGETVTITTTKGTRTFSKKNAEEYVDEEGNIWLKDGTTIAPVYTEAFGTLLADDDKSEKIQSVE